MAKEQGQRGPESIYGVEPMLDEMRERADLEACILAREAQELLGEYGMEATLISGEKITVDTDGDPNTERVLTTQSCFEVPVGGEKYYVRPVTFLEADEPTKIYFALDETEDFDEILVRAVDLIRLEIDEDKRPLLISQNGENVPIDVNLTLNLVRNIDKQEADRLAARAAEEQRQEESRQRIERQRQFDEEVRRREEVRLLEIQKRNQRSSLAKAFDATKRNLRDFAGPAVTVLAIGAALTAIYKVGGDEVIKNITCADGCEIEQYDAKKPRITEGTIIRIGQTVNPKKTFQVDQDPLLRRETVPEIGDQTQNFYGPDVDTVDSENPADITAPRQIVLTSSDPKLSTTGPTEGLLNAEDLACESSHVKLKSLDDALIMVTDIAGSRTDDIEVKLTQSKIFVCWTKGAKELDGNDDPRVIFQRATLLQIMASDKSPAEVRTVGPSPSSQG